MWSFIMVVVLVIVGMVLLTHPSVDRVLSALMPWSASDFPPLALEAMVLTLLAHCCNSHLSWSLRCSFAETDIKHPSSYHGFRPKQRLRRGASMEMARCIRYLDLHLQ